MKKNTRRSFIRNTVATAAVVCAGGTSALAALSTAKDLRPIHAFTKCLQFLNYDEMAEVLAKQGFAGADLTVRPKGQVLPENVKKDLPRVYKALTKAGLKTDMIATAINTAEDPLNRDIVKTMAELGIQHYRMGYLPYNSKKTIPENLEEHKRIFEALEKLNREYGVTGNYQNHSGTKVGGPVWDLYHLIKDCNPEYLGVQYDIRHATVEGGTAWPLGLKLLAPWITTTDIKDFLWEKINGKWKPGYVPLGKGMVDFDAFFTLFKSLEIKGPISIHYEYDLGGAEHGNSTTSMPLSEIERYMHEDLLFLKAKLQEFNL